ncbi:tyrosine-type recombinase/integrase [Oscillospiraceae bacterium 21-37]
MSNIIRLDFAAETKANEIIDIKSVKDSSRRLKAGLIAPASEKVEQELAQEHAAEPIKDMNDIIRISQYLISEERFRDNMLFIVGINFGLRVSDLRTLRFSNLINDDFTFRDRFPILEKKTKNTRKRQKNRYITINSAVIDAVTLYLENTPGVRLDDYMFKSASNNSIGKNVPISKQGVDLMLKGVARDLGLGNRMATHSLRKTFAYHQMVMSGNDPRKLLLLQKMFGHSSAAQTLDYIGITSEEIDDAYRNLNLGSTTQNYMMNTDIKEYEIGSA